jgi:hypothetical protein
MIFKLTKPSKEQKIVGALILAALSIRIYFSLDGSRFYFGEVVHTWKDTYTYLDSFKNWWHLGNYQFDLQEPDSRFFRPPGYPLFLGLFYLLTENYERIAALAQVLIDTASCLLSFLIVRKLTKSFNYSILGCAIYATYPFLIVWVPILYVEALIAHLTLLIIYISLGLGHKKWLSCFCLGALAGILFLTKQYMILLAIFPITFILLRNWQIKQKAFLIGALGFGLASILTPWILRNYIVSGELIISRGESTGIIYVGRDFEAFERFVNLFDQNVTPYRSAVAHEGTLQLSRHEEFVEKHKQAIDSASNLAYECGASFTSLRGVERNRVYEIDCTDEVISRFQDLTRLAWSELPLISLLQTRIEAVAKIFVGNIENDPRLSHRVLYAYRFIVLILGIAAIIFLLSKKDNELRSAALAFLCTWFALSALFALHFVHVEIRYMLIPDLLLILAAPYGVQFLGAYASSQNRELQ